MPIHTVEDMTSDAYTEAWLVGPQSTKFYTRTYLAPANTGKAAVVFIHGFADHCGRYTQAHPVFAQRGINVFTFDERGFGKTALDAENKSKSSVYGKTNGPDQMEDIKWALKHAEKEFPGLPLFLVGHSMGGGEVLNFSTRHNADAAAMLKGVIASSPLVHQTKPASKISRFFGGIAAIGLPYFSIPVTIEYKDLSHDEGYNNLCRIDPLAKIQGTLRGISDMLDWGEELLEDNHKKWPKTLPVLFVHGSGDQITSHTVAQQFYEKIGSQDKKFLVYPGGFHELVHEPEHREKLLEDMVAFIEERIPAKAAAVEAKL